GRLPGLRRGRWRGDGHENSSSWGFSETARTELPVRAAFTPAPRPRFDQTTEPWRADNQGYHLRAVATVRANAYSQATLTRHATRRDRGDRRADFHVGDRGAGRRAAPRGEQLAAATPRLPGAGGRRPLQAAVRRRAGGGLAGPHRPG